MPTAKSLILAAGSAALYTTRYVTNRIHRKLDERDNLLRDALYKMESKDISEYPCILTVGELAHTTQNSDIPMVVKHALGDGVKATSKIFAGEDYEMTITAVLPGVQSFAIAWAGKCTENALGVGAQATCSWDGSTLTIYAASNATSWNTVIAALDDDPIANKLANFVLSASNATDTALDTATVSTTINATSDGEGEIPVLYVGSVGVALGGSSTDVLYSFNCTEITGDTEIIAGSKNIVGITSFADSAIVFDVPLLAAAENLVHNVQLTTAGSSPVMCNPVSILTT